MAEAYMDTIRLVGEMGDPPLSVGPDADGLGCVRIWTDGEKARANWGSVDFMFSPAVARLLSQALAAAADEAEAMLRAA